jgi:hypothetical protein
MSVYRRGRGTLLRVGIVGLISGCLLAVNAVGASAVPSPPSPAAPDRDALKALGVTVAADGWISYTKSKSSTLGLSGVTTRLVRGSRSTDGVCVSAGRLTTTGQPTYVEEVAFNPKTCAARVLTGVITAKAAARLVGEAASETATAQSKTAPSTKRGTEVLAATTYYQSAHTVTRWIDPLNITITRQAINLKWPLYGAGGTLRSSWPSYKFPYDGWSVSGPHFSGFKSLSDGSGWYVSANSHFVNYDFAALVYALLGLSGWLACGAHFTTRADFYHNVKVTGKRNNSAVFNWNDRKSGACSNLVHHNTSTGFGWY